MELFGLYRAYGNGTSQLICASIAKNKLKEHIPENEKDKYKIDSLFLPFPVDEKNSFVSLDADFEGSDTFYDCNQYYRDIETAKYEEERLNGNRRRTYLARAINII
jgi:hypothetical protein